MAMTSFSSFVQKYLLSIFQYCRHFSGYWGINRHLSCFISIYVFVLLHTVMAWTSYVASLSLRFLICKMRVTECFPCSVSVWTRLGSRFDSWELLLLFWFAISHPSIDVYFCFGTIEFAGYRECLYLRGSFQNSNEGQVSWLFVLFTLVLLLSAQRNGNWLYFYGDSPKFSWELRNPHENVPCPQEALHVAGCMELKRMHQAHRDFNEESCLFPASGVPSWHFLHGNHFPSVESCHLPFCIEVFKHSHIPVPCWIRAFWVGSIFALVWFGLVWPSEFSGRNPAHGFTTQV